MGAGLNLLSTLTLLGAAQGIFLALVLFKARGGDLRAHRLLAWLTLLFAIDLGEEFLYQVGFFDSLPHLLHLLAPIDLLYGPLIYLYVVQLTGLSRQASGVRDYRHFLPALAGILLLLPFYLMTGADKLDFTESLRRGGVMENAVLLVQAGFIAFMLATIVQLGLYLLVSIRLLVAHAARIRNQFSDIDRINLAWLRNLLVGLVCIYLLYLGDQLFPDLLGINVLGDAITVIAVLLIYTMGYLGLRQPVIFTPAVAPAPATEATGTAAAKYRRSGLDRETGRVFLDELRRHMETAKPYLEGNLVLPQLARQLGISPNYLSQVINEQLNVNFYDFVNGYRVEEARRLMREAGQKNVNILSIALDSGFNSKSAFYTAFKKVASMTPTQYRKSLQ
jgi:AraC-like DNA-binding protein